MDAKHPSLPWPRPLIASTPPKGARWLHELHRPGMLVRARVSSNGNVVLVTRDASLPQLPDIEAALRTLAGGEALFEGYVVAHEGDGEALEEALRNASPDLLFYTNDVLYLRGGYDLTGVALHWRKRILRGLFRSSWRSSMRVAFGDHVRGEGTSFWRRACAMGFDGIVSKSRDAPYDPLRHHWIWSPPRSEQRRPDSLIRPCA